ncbi:phospholipase D family protein [Mesorhizobium sp.]|uniref:phospholipase D family protein n=1 Tax=Mesorhizobium sp. TaxID=1871066 RepID=UPI00257E2346|nr:phospholipase D family protein [Mesorhizobium sp.]
MVLNGLNGSYLRNILESAAAELKNGSNLTERVDAAVAYVSDQDLLFEWCWKRDIPLRFWGRFDEGVPISPHILKRFLDRKSPNYVCRLVRQFHPKVIWWRGFGVYIGSANLSQSAWWKNVEVGVFLTDDELVGDNKALELELFFQAVHAHSSPLTDELYALIEQRSAALGKQAAIDREAAKKFWNTDYVQPWEGLGNVSGKAALDLRRDAFLNEWMQTLQLLRDLAAKVSADENRPSWVAKDAPWGAQADQFLHAHYYQNTFDGRRADYETHFKSHQTNPGLAEETALSWWRSLKSAPNGEDLTLNKWAPYLRQMLSAERIMATTEGEFAEILSHIHAAIEYARRVSNRAVGLQEGPPYNMSEKVIALAKHIYKQPERGGPSPVATLNYVLYGGPAKELPSRMWDALHDPKLRIENFGISAMGELVGWALPNQFPPRNGRTSKALRSLGHDVTVHV